MFIIVVMIVVSPLFGIVLANMVGYHEPLDVAAEKLGLKDRTAELNWTPLEDYQVPGLPPIPGYMASGFIGVALILGVGSLLRRLAAGRKS